MGAAVGVLSAAAQMPPIPPGYTAYQIEGPGIGAPPLPLKIEGDKLLAPPEIAMFFSVPESNVTEDRVQATFVFGSETARLTAVRDGDVFAGFIFGRDEQDEGNGIPVTFTPVGQEATLE